MKRQRQTLEEIVGSLSAIRTSWRDAHADAVLALLDSLRLPETYDESIVRQLLDANFEAGLTVVRLALDFSKDELILALKGELSGSAGFKRYQSEPEVLVAALSRLGAPAALEGLIKTPVSWRNILAERLKSGRGSAIKGQARGRFLEDETQKILDRVFGERAYDIRCRFVGVAKTSTEKADFAVPSKGDPRILIEVKAYGASSYAGLRCRPAADVLQLAGHAGDQATHPGREDRHRGERNRPGRSAAPQPLFREPWMQATGGGEHESRDDGDHDCGQQGAEDDRCKACGDAHVETPVVGTIRMAYCGDVAITSTR